MALFYQLDIAWYRDLLFLNVNHTDIYVYNTTSHEATKRLPNVNNASSIVVDWMTPKLYWSNPLQQSV